MPRQPQKTPPSPPARRIPITEQLQTVVNDATVQLVTDAFSEIDQHKRNMVQDLAKRGIRNMDQIADAAANLIKAALVRGISK